MMTDIPTFLDHPAVWNADSLGQRHDWCREYASLAPGAIRDRLETGPGLLLIKDFPLAEDDKEATRQAFHHWCSTLGHLLSQNEKGDTLFEVADAGLGPDDPRMRGPNTNRRLSFHTDRCDVIAFLCWRQARTGGENAIVSALHLYNEIGRRRPDLREVLLQPYVYKRHTVDLGNSRPWCEQPVFSFCDGHFACSFLRVLIDRADADPALPNLSARQREALDFLEAVAAEPGVACRFRQEPGDVLLLNNWVTLHRRAAFEDHDAPAEKRCLLRVWLSMPNSRPIDARFAANFGATTAGAIRGGFRVAGA